MIPPLFLLAALAIGIPTVTAIGLSPCVFPGATATASLRKYDSCAELDQSFTLYWSVSSGANESVHFALRRASTSTSQWMALGFPSVDDLSDSPMIDSRIVAGGCVASAAALAPRAFLVGSKSSSSALIESRAWIPANAGMEIGTDDSYSLLFERQFSYSGDVNVNDQWREMNVPKPIDTATRSVRIVYATGSYVADASGAARFGQHRATDRGYAVVNLLSGTATVETSAAMRAWRMRHGVLMAVAWGFFIPAGVLIARFGKFYAGWWFYCHRAFQMIGVALSTIAYGIGVSIIGTGTQTKHQIVGTILIVLCWSNPILALVRHMRCAAKISTNDSDAVAAAVNSNQLNGRRVWELAHSWIGRTAIVLSVIQIVNGIGILNAIDSATGAVADGAAIGLYGAWTGLVAVLFVCGEVKARCVRQRRESQSKVSGIAALRLKQQNERDHFADSQRPNRNRSDQHNEAATATRAIADATNAPTVPVHVSQSAPANVLPLLPSAVGPIGSRAVKPKPRKKAISDLIIPSAAATGPRTAPVRLSHSLSTRKPSPGSRAADATISIDPIVPQPAALRTPPLLPPPPPQPQQLAALTRSPNRDRVSGLTITLRTLVPPQTPGGTAVIFANPFASAAVPPAPTSAVTAIPAPTDQI